MYIISKETIDTAGRVKIDKIFVSLPKEVVPVFNVETKTIVFSDDLEKWPKSLRRKVDPKGRVCLPKWMIAELGEEFFISDKSAQEHALLPKKYF